MSTNDTPRTEAAYAKVYHFTNEEEATDAVASMRDFARTLERENAELRKALLLVKPVDVGTIHPPTGGS